MISKSRLPVKQEKSAQSDTPKRALKEDRPVLAINEDWRIIPPEESPVFCWDDSIRD